MKTVEFHEFGHPRDVVRCVEVDDPGPAAADEVIVDINAFPINPADLLLLEGRYASRPQLPAGLGAEGVGTIAAIGSGVRTVEVGQRVILMGRDNWTQRRRVKAATVVPVPDDVDVQQLCMLKVNPATARLMLDNFVSVSRGEFIIQNAANSAVGTNIIKLARAEGIRTVNVVRREAQIAPLLEAGGDVALVDGDDLLERVRAEVGDNLPKLAIDAVAGSATGRLASTLEQGGVVVNYGLLSGEPCQIGPDQLVFRLVTLQGFWLAHELTEMPPSRVADLYAELAGQFASGVLKTPIEATYPIDEIAAACEHASREGRQGKIVVLPS